MTPDPSSRVSRPVGSTSGAGSHSVARDPLFPRPVRRVFAGTLTLAGALVLLAAVGGREGDAEAAVQASLPDVQPLLGDSRLPLEVNARVEHWIGRFLGDQRASFEEYLVREGLYGGMVRGKLRARGMPEELLYLAMIESGFSSVATSPMHAAGLWQFLGATARHYGLTVDSWVDERRDPVRATEAALDYLDELFGEFGSWYLAAAAYNAGPQRVHAAMRRAGVRAEEGDEALYWQIIENLPRETREYVPRILAAALLAERAEHFGIEVQRNLPYLFDQVLVPGGTSLVRVAQALEVPPALLRELNPHLIRATTPPGRSFPVRIPQGEAHRVMAALPGR